MPDRAEPRAGRPKSKVLMAAQAALEAGRRLSTRWESAASRVPKQELHEATGFVGVIEARFMSAPDWILGTSPCPSHSSGLKIGGPTMRGVLKEGSLRSRIFGEAQAWSDLPRAGPACGGRHAGACRR